MNNAQDKIIQRQRRGLRDLADSFIKLDHTCLLGIQDLKRLSFFLQDDWTRRSILVKRTVDVGQRLERLNAIMAGDLESRVKYLTDPNDKMTNYWDVAATLICKGLDQSSDHLMTKYAIMNMIWSMDGAASKMERYILMACRAKHLDDATQEALLMRWSYLDRIHSRFSGGDTNTPRKSSSW